MTICVAVVVIAIAAPVVDVDIVTDDETLLFEMVSVPATEVVVDGRSILSNGVLRSGQSLDDPTTCGASKKGLEVVAGTDVLAEDIIVLRIDNKPSCVGQSQTIDIGDVRISVESGARAVPPEDRPVHVIRFHRTTTLAQRILENLLGYVASFCGGIVASWILLRLTEPGAQTPP